MANGTTRLALAEIQLKRESAQAEHGEMLKLSSKGSKLPKQPLKAGASEHNHSK